MRWHSHRSKARAAAETVVRCWLWAVSLALFVLAANAADITVRDPGPKSERAVKAAIIYRVAKFIEWPAAVFDTSTAPFVLCVVGDDDTLDAFDDVAGRQLNGHRIQVRRITGDMLDLRQCHVAFFPGAVSAETDYALNKLSGLPVLTIGEAEDFAERGGILALQTREQRVKFAFNLPTSKHAGLAVNAQLLKLATVVGHPQ